MNLPKEIYIVIVVETDGVEQWPVALETCLDNRCSKSATIKRAKEVSKYYNAVKIGRLVFDMDETIDLSDAMTPEERAQPTWA